MVEMVELDIIRLVLVELLQMLMVEVVVEVELIIFE